MDAKKGQQLSQLNVCNGKILFEKKEVTLAVPDVPILKEFRRIEPAPFLCLRERRNKDSLEGLGWRFGIHRW